MIHPTTDLITDETSLHNSLLYCTIFEICGFLCTMAEQELQILETS